MKILRAIVVSILTIEARFALVRFRPKIVAITGSVGKTTTKDAIFQVLSTRLHVRKSEKSFNSEIGVPLTILGLENGWRNPITWALNLLRGALLLTGNAPYPKWLILEVGADRPGDIRSIARWLQPDIAVITGVPEIPVHIEYFDSREALMKEKRALAEHIKAGGTLVINGDDHGMPELGAEYAPITKKYGFEEENDFVGSGEEILYENGQPVGERFRVDTVSSSRLVEVRGALGRVRVYSALAALALGAIAGIDEEESIRALASWVPPPGRMRILQGANNSTIIDDTYNSSPAATLSALDTLQALKVKRKIAVLGDMLELGKYSSEAHHALGARAVLCADRLITVGIRTRAIAESALDTGMPEANIRQYELDEATRAGRELRAELQQGDCVLVKGSQSMRMERAVLALLEDGSKAKGLLVRQEDEWKNR